MKRIISALLSILLALAAMASASVPAQACGDQSNEGTSRKEHYGVIETYPQLYSVEGNHFTPAEISAEFVSTIYVSTKPCYSINDIAKITGTTDSDLWYLTDWQRFWPDSNYATFPLYDDYSEDYTVLADVRTPTQIGASERLVRDRPNTATAIPFYNTGFHIAVDWYTAEVGELYLVA